MKIIISSLTVILMLVSPLFSALLTHNLEVISPTGMPLPQYEKHACLYTPGSSSTISFCFVETSRGMLLVREYKRGGLVQFCSTLADPGVSQVFIKSSPARSFEGDIIKKNVILE
jgi:hypothetical protein